jgi:hypothetical protein
MNEENNPFVELSNLFVENQRQFNIKSDELISRLDVLNKKLSNLKIQLETNIFSADLIAILNIEQESSLILSVAKELEFQRDQINNSLELLKETKKIKLNK